ncbi:penicillin acylase family protein [Streptomyces sp. NPDC001552]|uniref:penicillin acylase family protein n=1 Tax=Streptomyces sp. NPDC001552 TaxID=3364587 RepID=UPI0036B0F031
MSTRSWSGADASCRWAAVRRRSASGTRSRRRGTLRGGYSEVTHGSSHIQAVGWDGGRCPVAGSLLTYSQSSNPLSPYCADQTRMYSEERWVTARFCERDILTSPKLKVVLARERR